MAEPFHTGAREDKHFLLTCVFVALVALNHRTKMEMDHGEILIVATALGLGNVVSKLTALSRLGKKENTDAESSGERLGAGEGEPAEPAAPAAG